jgi:hypothetical protein
MISKKNPSLTKNPALNLVPAALVLASVLIPQDPKKLLK